jgi:hypothetical protein
MSMLVRQVGRKRKIFTTICLLRGCVDGRVGEGRERKR